VVDVGGRNDTVRTLEALTEHDVDVAGLTVHLLQRGSGPVAVVLHHSTGPMWTPFHDALAEHYTVLAPEVPGYGRSTRPVTARHPSHLGVLLHQCLDVMGHRQVHVVGLGFGGWLAAEMAAMNQARFLTMTLVGAAGLKPRHGMIHDPMMESWTDYARQSFRDDASFIDHFGRKPTQDLIDLWDFSREMTARVTWKPWMWSLQLPQLLRAVTTPSLIVWGRDDRIVPLDCGEQYAEILANAQLQIVDEAGHVVDLEQPDRLAEMVVAFAAHEEPHSQN
jgi:pimeloyl-ACP methyl ester carboxylesterase